MVKKYTPSKVSAKVDRLLRGLLRSPKAKPGLIAAVASHGVTEKFVNGWLIASLQSGQVVKHGGGRYVTYQMTADVLVAPDLYSEFPEWLCPRTLPITTKRLVILRINVPDKEEV